jgi:haloacetate dehalogenase
LPERLIGAETEHYLIKKFQKGLRTPSAITPKAMEEYIRCFTDSKTIHATCEDYRAAAGIDLEHDRQDLDRPITSVRYTFFVAERVYSGHYSTY